MSTLHRPALDDVLRCTRETLPPQWQETLTARDLWPVERPPVVMVARGPEVFWPMWASVVDDHPGEDVIVAVAAFGIERIRRAEALAREAFPRAQGVGWAIDTQHIAPPPPFFIENRAAYDDLAAIVPTVGTIGPFVVIIAPCIHATHRLCASWMDEGAPLPLETVQG